MGAMLENKRMVLHCACGEPVLMKLVTHSRHGFEALTPVSKKAKLHRTTSSSRHAFMHVHCGADKPECYPKTNKRTKCKDCGIKIAFVAGEHSLCPECLRARNAHGV